jgi:hypothetical protein
MVTAHDEVGEEEAEHREASDEEEYGTNASPVNHSLR